MKNVLAMVDHDQMAIGYDDTNTMIITGFECTDDFTLDLYDVIKLRDACLKWLENYSL